jgi:concentrative nucleoside transporter, CNT family
VIDAAAQGAGDGLRLALNIAGMLIAFLALIAMFNGILGWTRHYIGWLPTSLESMCGTIFAPIAWILGVPWQDAPTVGGLLGTRLITNEMVAFQQLGPLKDHMLPQSSPLPHSRCAGLRTSAPSRYRLAALARWRRTASPIWRAWACER